MELLISCKGKTCVVFYDDCDQNLVNKFKWNIQTNKTGISYARGSEIGNMSNRVYMHRLIMAPLTREELIDHKNGDGLDNRRNNLRKCSKKQNSYNSKPRRGLFKGIEKSKDRWVPRLEWEGIKISMGRFDTEVEAASVYNKVASKIFGEFARLNLSEKQEEKVG